MIKLIITDADDTLYPWKKPYVDNMTKALEVISRETGIAVNDLMDVAGAANRQIREIEEIEQTMTLLSQSYAISGAALEEACRTYYDGFLRDIKKACSCRGFLRKAEKMNIPVVVLSESHLLALQIKLCHCGLDKYVTATYCRSDGNHQFGKFRASGFTKPDLGVLSQICSDWSVQPEEVLYLGDSCTRDMLAAKKMGMRTAWCHVHGALYAPEELTHLSNWGPSEFSRERELREEWDSSGHTPDLTYTSWRQLANWLDECEDVKVSPKESSVPVRNEALMAA